MGKKHLNRRWKFARQPGWRRKLSPWVSWRDDTGGILVDADGEFRAFIPIAQLRAFIERHDRGV